jgi:hypothetical protein
MSEIEPIHALPVALRIRAWPGETVFSFASRLERNLKATKRVISHLAYCDATRVTGKKATPRQTAERMMSLCEALCVLPTGTLAPIAPMNNRPFSSHLCRECVGGIAVEHTWSGGRYTCERHRRWIAPGPSPEKPSAFEPHPPGDYALMQLSQPVVDADLRIAALLAEGRISVALIDEITRRIDSACGQEHWGIPRPCDLPVTAAALAAVTDPDIHSIILNETVSFAERYFRLHTLLVNSVAALTPVLCDRLWLLLRQTIAWTRTTFFNEVPVEGFEPIIVPDPTLRLPSARYPLEPFRRSMACLRTAGTNADEWWQDRYMVVQSSPVEAPLLMCDNGHVQRTLKHHTRRIEGEDFRCSICTGQRVVAGLNSLADLMPKIAADWDQAANGDLTPFMVTPGANIKVGWIDDNGHHYDAWIPNRTLQGTGCPFCAAKAVLAGHNDLTTTHPQLAALWDDEANGDRKVTQVSAGNSKDNIHLRCDKGHAFIRTPANLVSTEGRCPTCHGCKVIPGVNDLATLRPDVAAWWHPHMNGDLTPEMVTPGSGRRVWWLCDDGHEFPADIDYRCRQKNRTCSVDTGWWLLRGVNDIATKEPDLATDWNSAMNGIQPSQTVATNHPWWWTCAYGHDQHATVASRRRAGGCTDCAPEDRVAQPQRTSAQGTQGGDTRKAT